MAQMKFHELVEEARTRTPQEQLKLRELLDSWITTQSMTDEERQAELDKRLMAKGLLSRIPPPITDFTPYRDRKPIEIEGEPLSQTIIRDRGE